MPTRPVALYRPRLALAVKSGLRLAVAATLALVVPSTALADTDPLETVVPANPAPAAAKPDAKGAKAGAKPIAVEDRAARGVVVIERAGQPLALGAVLAGDGRILSSLSPLGSGNNLDVRFADGTTARVKLGHHDRAWDLALLVPQSGRWSEGLIASAREPVRPGASIHAFTLNKGKISAAPILLRSHRSLLGGDDKPLDNAIEIGSRVNPVDLGSPVIDEDGRVVAILGRGCAPVENRPCTPVAFGAPINSIKAFLRTVPATAVAPAAWLGIQGTSETGGIAKGVRVVSVHPDSPAAEASLQGGERGASDVILAVDGAPVTSPEALAEAIRAHGIGEKVPLMVLGQGKYRQVTIVLRAAPDAKATRHAPANPAELPAGNAASASPATLPPAKKSRRR